MNWKNLISNNGKDVSKGKFLSMVFAGIIAIGELYAVIVEHKFIYIPEGLLLLVVSLLGYNASSKFIFAKYLKKYEEEFKDASKEN